MNYPLRVYRDFIWEFVAFDVHRRVELLNSFSQNPWGFVRPETELEKAYREGGYVL